ncbi:MAG: fibronectin type III domain-containing protein, partial [Pelosinus sp.]|nr:fibronectin type III domain-containing protein [Pelosinus sp.]
MKKYGFRFLIVCGIVFVCCIAIAKYFAAGYTLDEANILHVITADMKHEHTISWKTESLGEQGYLEIRSKQAKNIVKIDAEAAELPAYNGQPAMRYTAHLTNLLPGTDYEYRVAVGKRQSVWKTFKTEPEVASFKTLIFGDSQSVSYKDWAKTVQNAWENNRDAAFFINMGDLVDNGQDNSQWNSWFTGAAPLLGSLPIAPVMGNHETYSLDWKMAKPDYYLALFSLPDNGPEGL